MVTRQDFNEKFILPSKGRMSGFYGSQRILNSKPRRPHAGIDIAAKEGTSVIAPSSGIIKISRGGYVLHWKYCDNGSWLRTNFNFCSLEGVFVEKGEKVLQGQKNWVNWYDRKATGPHLHWGVYLNNTSVDPEVLLKYELN